MQQPIHTFTDIAEAAFCGGIYGMHCKPEEKWYIGSSINIGLRLDTHFSKLRVKKKNKNPKLQEAWDKHGRDAFVFAIFEYCDEDMLLEREHHIIENVGWEHLYNITKAHSDIYTKGITLPMKKVNITDKCWEWTGFLTKDGYGQIFRNKKAYMVHRVAYMTHHKIDIRNHVVRHMCNNKKCCNPHHLKLGSIAQNSRDGMSDKDIQETIFIEKNWKQLVEEVKTHKSYRIVAKIHDIAECRLNRHLKYIVGDIKGKQYYEAFGESKTAYGWSKDKRCPGLGVMRLTTRLKNQDIDNEKAITMPV